VTAFGKKTDDVQSETLWRIKECEELLRNRVSEKFVMDAIHSIDEKIKKQINHLDDKGIERLEKTFKEVSARVTQTNQFFNDKLDDVRKIMASYDSRFSNVASNSSVEKVQQGYKDMKYNFERELELIQDHMKEVQDKNGEVVRRMVNLENQMNGGGLFEQLSLPTLAQK
jgi:hypothetical protein